MRASSILFVSSLCGLLLTGLLTGCSGQKSETPENAGETAQTQTPAQSADAIVGEVLETMDSGGYTYVRVQSDGEDVWAAGPVTTMPVGAKVTISTKMPMSGFHSETLDRTFDKLYFVSDFGGTIEGPDGGMGAMTNNSTPMAAHGMTPAPDGAVGGIEPAEGGHTIGALYAARQRLAGTETKVRGQVVKYNAGIMGKNWVHLQDGTGDPSVDTHDLLVTTNATCKVGDTIVATGTVSIEKDFGAGYKYELLLEDAEIEVDGTTTGR